MSDQFGVGRAAQARRCVKGCGIVSVNFFNGLPQETDEGTRSLFADAVGLDNGGAHSGIAGGIGRKLQTDGVIVEFVFRDTTRPEALEFLFSPEFLLEGKFSAPFLFQCLPLAEVRNPGRHFVAHGLKMEGVNRRRRRDFRSWWLGRRWWRRWGCEKTAQKVHGSIVSKSANIDKVPGGFRGGWQSHVDARSTFAAGPLRKRKIGGRESAIASRGRSPAKLQEA